ncbi:hypothetical protein HV265_08775 [Citrobacter sp. RHBSTW-00678]|uniref:DUF4145 domain-containing protein n=2 Tax=Enterobacteriaceae TaxID=543 RepID=A0AAD1L452_CITBR|nr:MULTISPECIES: hypothetical protein [Citrobacter]AUV26652.1 hypothetical protein C2U38_14045 [Citrobacter freundii complex sp. CFNIH3]ELA7615524.1 hypothetical protein [Citrobacter freundii]MBA7758260.1 hypothetical protein [Citrobacter sp. RHBSTW-00325]MBA8058722.1 hypothetical protein [Citrobacter sp. RHBSTW-00104]POV68137.1 hypothetical protein C3411_17595 [Citrobacter freundii complex sp. CFNIH5]
MNFYVFMNVAQFDVVPDSMIQIMSTTDNIGAVLRSHLICEQLAEAWVCGICNNENVFGTADDRVKIECNAKLKVARNLGLPIPLYNAMKRLNTLRNLFAHTHQADISDNVIASITDNIRSMSPDRTLVGLADPEIEIYDEDGSVQGRHLFSSTATPGRIKLAVLTAEIIRHTVQKAQEINTARSIADFTMR